jgi:hypothetical protein
VSTAGLRACRFPCVLRLSVLQFEQVFEVFISLILAPVTLESGPLKELTALHLYQVSNEDRRPDPDRTPFIGPLPTIVREPVLE